MSELADRLERECVAIYAVAEELRASEEDGYAGSLYMAWGELRDIRTALRAQKPSELERGDWRKAEGAAPRLPGDDLSPEDAIRLIRDGEPPSEPATSFCSECGFNVECDEDGCCVTCGATAMGTAVRALRVFSPQWRQAPTEEDHE